MKMLNVNINGNKKLQNTDKVRYMIWNLPSVKTCPFCTPSCEKSCYARKAERVYPQVLPSREQNYNDSLESDFVSNMIYTIEKHLNSKAFNGRKAIFRIHESGDFYNVEYTRKWIEIVKHFEHDTRITFLVYTKSLEYFIACGYGRTCLPRNPLTDFPTSIVIRSSLWNDTKQKYVDLTKVYNFPIYAALSPDDMETARNNGKQFAECTCENCSTCGKCWSTAKEDKNIIVKIH